MCDLSFFNEPKKLNCFFNESKKLSEDRETESCIGKDQEKIISEDLVEVI